MRCLAVSDRSLESMHAEVLPEPGHVFEIRVEKAVRHVYRDIQRLLTAYKDEKRGPTYIAVQSSRGAVSCHAVSDA